MKLKLTLTTEEVLEALFPNLPDDVGVAIEVEETGAERTLPPLAMDGESATEDVCSNEWRPISLYFAEKGKHDWALVQFKEKVSGFAGIPHICEWRKSGKFGEGWYTQDGEDDMATFDYLNDFCSAIAFFEWPGCSVDADKEAKE